MTFIKLLKVVLPVATATSATIATTLLVSSFNKKDVLLNSENLDNPLDDLKLPDEKFEDTKKFYAENGTGDGQTPLNEETTKKIADLLDKAGDLKDPVNLNRNLEDLQEEIDNLVKSATGESELFVSGSESSDGEHSIDSLRQPSPPPSNVEEEVSRGTLGETEESEKNSLPSGNGNEEESKSLTSESPLSKPESENSSSHDQIQDTTLDNPDQREQTPIVNGEDQDAVGQEEEVVENHEAEGPAKSNEKSTEGEATSDLREGAGDEVQETENISSSSPKSEEAGVSRGKEKLSEDDIKKWQELGDKLSSFSESLKQLFEF